MDSPNGFEAQARDITLEEVFRIRYSPSPLKNSYIRKLLMPNIKYIFYYPLSKIKSCVHAWLTEKAPRSDSQRKHSCLRRLILGFLILSIYDELPTFRHLCTCSERQAWISPRNGCHSSATLHTCRTWSAPPCVCDF